MGFLELFILAIGLSMDAMAVAISIGLSCCGRRDVKKAVVIGLYFGVFQAIMPIIGFFAAIRFAGYIDEYAHWIAFGLLLFLGGKMIYGSFQKDEDNKEVSLSPKEMLPLAVATSIDALAVGVSFAILHVNIFVSAGIIGVITFIASAIGAFAGQCVGGNLKAKANFVGGLILVLIGIRILVV